jgi:hypothetical protein
VELFGVEFAQVLVTVLLAAIALLAGVALLVVATEGRNVRSLVALRRSPGLVRATVSDLRPDLARRLRLPARAPPLTNGCGPSRLGVHPRE